MLLGSLVSELFLFLLYDLSFPCRYFWSATSSCKSLPCCLCCRTGHLRGGGCENFYHLKWIQHHAKPCINKKHFLPVLLSSDGRLCLTPVCVAATIIRNHTRTRTHLCLHYTNVAHNQRSGIEDELKGSLLMILCPLQIWRSDRRLSCLAWEGLVLLRWSFLQCGII